MKRVMVRALVGVTRVSVRVVPRVVAEDIGPINSAKLH